MSSVLARLCAVTVSVVGLSASASPNDIELYRLDDPRTAPLANANFRTFARELGAAITSTTLMPPDTLGHSGFAMNAELTVLNFRAGTEAGDFFLPIESAGDPSDSILMPSLHIRKGFPFSIEVGARAGWIEKSDIAVGTLEGKWAINEGFLYLPDVAVRAYVTRLFNARQLDLTSYGFDLSVGREFPIGGMITLTPYAGWNLGVVSASSQEINFAPERPFAETIASPYTSINDSTAYDPVNDSHNRFYAGLRFIGGVVQLGFEVSFVSLGKISVEDEPALTSDRSLPAVTTVATTIGLDF